jgi:hypothetical protein
VYVSSIKKLVLIVMRLIVISTPYIIPKNPLVKLFTKTIFAHFINLGSKVIDSIAFFTIDLYIVFSLALESSRLRNYISEIVIRTFRYS